MHQNSANRVQPRAPIFASPGVQFVQNADGLDRFPRVREFRRVMQNENRSVRCHEPSPGGLEMPCQNGPLIHPAIGKEPVSRLRVCPIPTSQWNGLSKPGCQLPDEFPESPTEPRVTEPAASQFLVEGLC